MRFGQTSGCRRLPVQGWLRCLACSALLKMSYLYSFGLCRFSNDFSLLLCVDDDTMLLVSREKHFTVVWHVGPFLPLTKGISCLADARRSGIIYIIRNVLVLRLSVIVV